MRFVLLGRTPEAIYVLTFKNNNMCIIRAIKTSIACKFEKITLGVKLTGTIRNDIRRNYWREESRKIY